MFDLRLKLDHIVLDKENQTKILENLRYCRRIVGKQFEVIFWNQNLQESDIKTFLSESSNLLFEVNTTITKKFKPCWFLVTEGEDKSRSRYSYGGDILDGIVNYMEIAKHVKLKEIED